MHAAHCTANEAKAVPSLFVARARASSIKRPSPRRSLADGRAGAGEGGLNEDQLTAILAYGAKGSIVPVRSFSRYDRSVAEIGAERKALGPRLFADYILRPARDLALSSLHDAGRGLQRGGGESDAASDGEENR